MSSPPDPKRPKLDDTQNSPEDEFADSSDESCFEGMSSEEIEEFQQYEKQLNESDGFDVDFFPTAFPRVLWRPIFPCNLNDPKEYEEIEKCTQFGIKKYNELMKGNSRLRLERIPKANRTMPQHSCNFYITFEAEDIVSGGSDTYQAKVNKKSMDGSLGLIFIRKKCDKKQICIPVDLDDQGELVRVNELAALTVFEYNEEQEGKSDLELEFVKLVKALKNMNMLYLIYWITFEAKDPKSDQINTYSAQIEYDPDHHYIHILDWLELEEHE